MSDSFLVLDLEGFTQLPPEAKTELIEWMDAEGLAHLEMRRLEVLDEGQLLLSFLEPDAEGMVWVVEGEPAETHRIVMTRRIPPYSCFGGTILPRGRAVGSWSGP